MRLPSLAVLSTTLLPCATACLEFIGKVTGYSELGNPMLLTANMYDNGAWICLYHGTYTPGVEQYLQCVSGKYAWVKVTYNGWNPAHGGNAWGPPTVVVAYARDSLNFRFNASVKHYPCLNDHTDEHYLRQCFSELSASMYGCSSLTGFAEDGTYSDGEGEQVSATADVVVTGIETAAGTKATMSLKA